MATAPIRTKRWTRLEYERLVGLGAFGPGDRIELVGGDLLVLPPQGSPHMTAIGLAEDVLRAAFGGAWHIRTQGPIALDNESEPDGAVVSGSRRHYSASHPTQPVLLGSTRPTARRRRRLRLAVYGDPALSSSDIVAPLGAPEVRIAVADLLQ
jgi:hypothetical protein